ncbi:PhlD (plasmid) [Kitasatospora sp. NBC_01246]|uniref:PhlD n=1 Tax=Kitasatospora sp. NBC_01246 TaxID=2903570 RepID=UPI002E2EC151|nr:PhlD [Kitasatospora sp. NBC_01246]
MSFVSNPYVFLPNHVVTSEELADVITSRHAGHPRLPVIRRIVAQAPARRHFSQPLDIVMSDRTLEERNRAAVDDVLTMGTAAARGVLAELDVDPLTIDCIITTHSTGDIVPGLDIHLVHELGLRPDVSRRPITQLGCGGGAHIMVMAHQYVSASPGSRVLVVGAESLSSTIHAADTEIEQVIYSGLWGDGAVAAVVSSSPIGPALRIHETWEYLLPDTTTRYRKRVDHSGVHFDSERSATQSINEMAPALRAWLADETAGPWPLDFMVAHPGGLRVMEDLEKQLQLGPDALRHSRAQFDAEANLGGPSVLSVLRRTMADPPEHGQAGLAAGFAPGFAVSAMKVSWCDPS